MTMTHRRNPSSILGFVLAALLLSPALAADPSLADVMKVNSIPEQCLRIYETPVPGCTETDFETQSCSSACMRGLQSMQNSLQQNCRNVRARADTLLGQTLMGNLVSIICRNSVRPQPTTTLVPRPTTTIGRNLPPSTTSESRQGPGGIQTPQPTPTPDNGGGGNNDGNDDGGDDEPTGFEQFDRPQGAGGSPFDIIASSSARSEPLLGQVVLATLLGIVALLG
ncbi:unnamed protein product [Parascedosporium putredinis]|uniref:Elicitin-like protein n=1 Tax=Parascedosporium putredinis TaxID=1442378 RepID=A0A9P1MF68_9PEZI|nr:unnamed protein product [Parascedosporium putredinis]CAI8002890.1 unnamed protein product [Parascedosporium putredinis]